ncbi:MAG TPA: hypothetical protein PKC28_01715 [Bdellovibrionales bacterium]|nr:hypothetical protein [Bdellovibrionales bacterium]
MSRLLALAIIICLPVSALAYGNRGGDDGYRTTRDTASIIELIPDFEELQCTSTCEGNSECRKITDANSCLEQSEALGCFWSCE